MAGQQRDPGAPAGVVAPRKLGVGVGTRLAVVSSPDGFTDRLGPLPDDVVLRTEARGRLDVILFFVTRRAELARRFPAFTQRLEPGGGLWVAWPKRTSGVASDLSFGVVQRVGLDCGFVDDKVAAIDTAWSGVRFVQPDG